ncbi:MAG UNVERIFIED_CONTAM: hypothetical protein LVR29_31280 [Microcystis novacekii LVE1205-3]|jgi:hypothetical protein
MAPKFISFPYIAQLPNPKTHLLIEPLRLLEKARIYAARDGDAELLCLLDSVSNLVLFNHCLCRRHQAIKGHSTAQNCLEWAERLIKNALDCYGERGRKSYQQIKNYSGKQTEFVISNIVYEKYIVL